MELITLPVSLVNKGTSRMMLDVRVVYYEFITPFLPFFMELNYTIPTIPILRLLKKV